MQRATEWGAQEQGEGGCVWQRSPRTQIPWRAGLCAQGSRKAGVASVCLAGGDGTEVGGRERRRSKRGSWGPGGDYALIK